VGDRHDDAAALLGRDAVRARLLPWTRRAYRLLPPVQRPLVLDAGCGTGVPTLELARLSGGRVVAVDVDPVALRALQARAAAAGLGGSVLPVLASLRDLELAPASCDLAWCEGAVTVLGVAAILRRWRPWLRPGGCLVLHCDLADLEAGLEQAGAAGFALLGHFEVRASVWRREFFAPLARRLDRLRRRHAGDPALLAAFGREVADLEAFSRCPERCASAFLALRRT